jgi:hypothetical protein
MKINQNPEKPIKIKQNQTIARRNKQNQSQSMKIPEYH